MKKILNCHPSLYYTAEELQAVAERVQTDTDFAAEYEKLKQQADDLFTKEWLTEEQCNSVYSQHGRYYEPGHLLEKMADLFPLMTAVSGEEKYFDFAREKLLYYAGFRVWTGPANGDRRTPWHSELATTRILNAFCQLYDAYYDKFTREERDHLADAMLRKGIDPLYADWVDPTRRVHALDSMGHNWWAVCIGYCGIGVVTLFDRIENAEEKLTLIAQAMEDFCTYQGHPLLNKVANFDSQGMFYESANYFSYGVGELLNFRLVMHRNTDYRMELPLLQQVGNAILPMTYLVNDPQPSLWLVNYGDSYLGGNSVAFLFRMLLLNGLGDDRHRYYYHTCMTARGGWDLIYASVLHAPTQDTCFGEAPLQEMYPQTGYGFWRTSWQANATLLGIRCGFTWGHAHNDAGSFILWHKGKRLLVDSGTTAYESPYYRRYFCAEVGHNLVTVKGRELGELFSYRGTKFRGTIPEYHHGQWLSYCLCDATGPSADVCLRKYRSILWLDEEVYVVIDDLLTYQPQTLQWMLHFEGEGIPTSYGIRVQNGDAQVDVYQVYPSCPGQIMTLPQEVKVSPEAARYWQEEWEQTQTDSCFIHVLALSSVTVTPLQGDSYQGVAVQKGDVTYRVYYNQEADGRKMHENSNNRVGDYDTDAYIVVDRTQNGQVKRFVAYGSYLRLGDEILFDDYNKRFSFIE